MKSEIRKQKVERDREKPVLPYSFFLIPFKTFSACPDREQPAPIAERSGVYRGSERIGVSLWLNSFIFYSILMLSVVNGQTDDSGLIEFSHDLHVSDLEIKCTKCHSPKLLKTSMTSDDLILPTEKRCLKCHKVWKEDNECENCHVGDEPYSTFPVVKRNFRFPHKIHWVDQKIDCQVCHSDMAGVANRPPLPDMTDCMKCHQERKAPDYCEVCHENVAFLRPNDHSATWLKDHDVAALSSSSDCQLCHTQLTCDNCHSGAVLGTDDLVKMNPVPSYRSDLSSGKQLLNRNHAIDYVFSHGLDASTKTKDCSVCHESPEFCSDCHQNETELLLNKPGFHGGLDWGAVQYSSDTDFTSITGGNHADMARRDIELCFSCHDLEGGDPICINCHTDTDGVLFTDPKTHATGYMRNTQGDWCTEPVSLCFVCHTQESSKGTRFCGYCH